MQEKDNGELEGRQTAGQCPACFAPLEMGGVLPVAHSNRWDLNKGLEVFVTLLSIIGAILISSGYPVAFYVFLISHPPAVWLFHRLKMKGMLLTQLIFTATTLNGIYTYYLKTPDLPEHSVTEEIQQVQEEIRQLREKLSELRKQVTQQPIKNFQLDGPDGDKVHLLDCFGDKKELLLIHNMGVSCSYCSLWADGINGLLKQLESRVAVIVLSPDEPKVQKECAESRGWKFKMLSYGDSKCGEELGFCKDSKYHPGVSALILDEQNNIYRSGKDSFGPGDDYCAIWHFWDLFPQGTSNWKPLQQV